MKKITLLSFALLFSYLGHSQDNVTIFGVNTDRGQLNSFQTDTPSVLNDLGDSSIVSPGDFEVAGDINPLDLGTAYVLTRTGSFFEVDLGSANYELIGMIAPPTDELWRGIEFDTLTNILYAVSSNSFQNGDATLSIINIEDVTSTPVGVIDLVSPVSIVTNGEGDFYTHDLDTDSLYTIDIETAETTLIGELGYDGAFEQDMEFDFATGTLWLAAFNNDTFVSELRTVDTTTGLSTLVGTIGSGFETSISWITIQNGPSILSVDNTNAVQVSVFPNPTQGVLNINSAVPMSQVTVYNSLGQNVATYEANNTQNYSVDTNGIANGLYVIELTTPSGVITEKFLKQ